MNTNTIWAWICTIAVCMSCTSGTEQQPSHLRVISMIPDTQATLTISGHSKGKDRDSQKKMINLPYASPVSYQIMPAGSYEFSYQTGNQAVLKGNYIIGSDGWYTLIITGLLPGKPKLNQKTRMFQLEHIFAGSEAKGTNGFLPQWFLKRDNYDGSTKQAYLRILNVSPTYDQLTIHKDDKKYGHLAYPRETEMSKLKQGRHRFSFYHQKIEVGHTAIVAKPGYIYTILAGDPTEAAPDTLRLPVLRNPSRALLNREN